MCKLIEGPRIPTELVPKTKKRLKRTKQAKEDVEVKYTLIREAPSQYVNELFELYKQDKYKARVKYFNSSKHNYKSKRTCIFELSNNDFEVCTFENTFGISVTNRMYSSQKKIDSVMFKNGKFYRYRNDGNVRRRNGVMPLTHWALIAFIRDCEGIGHDSDWQAKFLVSKTYELFTTKFPWVKTLHETEAAYGLAYNTILSKKLTGQKDLLRHVFKVPINIANIILKDVPSVYADENNRHYVRPSNRTRDAYARLKQWNEIKHVLDGVQNLTEEMYHHPHFNDTCDMAHKLGRRVNCRWGIKKLEQVHDDFSRDIRNILLDCDVEYMMKVRRPFYILARDTGWKLLFTNKEMLVEGVRQCHCVGGYIDKVERGDCAIFHINGFTLQVGIERVAKIPNKFTTSVSVAGGDISQEAIDRMLLHDANQQMREGDEKPKMYFSFKNLQFRGHRNCDPPEELLQRVNTILSSYANDTTQDMFEGKVDAEEIKAICEEIHKTKWTVAINHETGKYEITDKGLDGLDVKPALDIIHRPIVATNNANNLLVMPVNNGYQQWRIEDEALPF